MCKETIAYLTWKCQLCNTTNTDKFGMIDHLKEKHSIEDMEIFNSIMIMHNDNAKVGDMRSNKI